MPGSPEIPAYIPTVRGPAPDQPVNSDSRPIRVRVAATALAPSYSNEECSPMQRCGRMLPSGSRQSPQQTIHSGSNLNLMPIPPIQRQGTTKMLGCQRGTEVLACSYLKQRFMPAFLKTHSEGWPMKSSKPLKMSRVSEKLFFSANLQLFPFCDI